MPGTLKSRSVECGPRESIYVHYSGLVPDDKCQISPGLFAETMFNGELLERKFLMFGATRNSIFNVPCIGVWLSAASNVDILILGRLSSAYDTV